MHSSSTFTLSALACSLLLASNSILAAPTVNSPNSTNGGGGDERIGTSLDQPVFVSVPKQFNLTGQPVQIQGNNPYNSTNTTLAAPFLPAGGDQQIVPVYRTVSNFDFQSINLALNQEYIELDSFNNGLARFSVEDFEAAGLTAEDRSLIQYMANQEIPHAIALSSLLGGDRAAKMCTYEYPYTNVKEFVLFAHLITRFGESGVLGFLPHLDSRQSAQILLQTVTTESRQEMAFRQLQGLFPVPIAFQTGVPQSYHWTLLAPFLKTCPENNPRIQWQVYPSLRILNQPYALDGVPAVSTNRSLTSAGRRIELSWEAPGKVVGYNDSYITTTLAGEPTHAAFISQLNVTYAPLQDIKNRTAYVIQPSDTVYPGLFPIVNETVFVSLVDEPLFLTPYNLSLITNHTVAGPALYQSG